MPDNLFQFVDSNPNSVIAPMPNMLPVFAQQIQKQNQDYDTGQQEYNAYQDNINKSIPLDSTSGSKAIHDKLIGVWANANNAIKNTATGNMDFGLLRYRIPKFANDINKYSSALQSNNAAIDQAKKTAYDPNNKNQFSQQDFEQKLSTFKGLTEDPITHEITGYFDPSIRTKAVIMPSDFVNDTDKLLSSRTLAPKFFVAGTSNSANPIELFQNNDGKLVDRNGNEYKNFEEVMDDGTNVKNLVATGTMMTNPDGTLSSVITTKNGYSYTNTGKSQSDIVNASIAAFYGNPQAQEDARYLTKLGYYKDPTGYLQAMIDYSKTKAVSNENIAMENSKIIHPFKGGTKGTGTVKAEDNSQSNQIVSGETTLKDFSVSGNTTNNWNTQSNEVRKTYKTNFINAAQILNSYGIKLNDDGTLPNDSPVIPDGNGGYKSADPNNPFTDNDLFNIQQNINNAQLSLKQQKSYDNFTDSIITEAAKEIFPGIDNAKIQQAISILNQGDNRDQIVLDNKHISNDEIIEIAKSLGLDGSQTQHFEDNIRQLYDNNKEISVGQVYNVLNSDVPKEKAVATGIGSSIGTLISNKDIGVQILKDNNLVSLVEDKTDANNLTQLLNSDNKYHISFSPGNRVIVRGNITSKDGTTTKTTPVSYQLQLSPQQMNAITKQIEKLKVRTPKMTDDDYNSRLLSYYNITSNNKLNDAISNSELSYNTPYTIESDPYPDGSKHVITITMDLNTSDQKDSNGRYHLTAGTLKDGNPTDTIDKANLSYKDVLDFLSKYQLQNPLKW